MKFLEKLNFSKDNIAEILDGTPQSVINLIKVNKKLVSENISFLKELGVNNYQEVFIKYYDMFLIDNSNFKAIFDKYEKDDLVEKINKNISIVEYL